MSLGSAPSSSQTSCLGCFISSGSVSGTVVSSTPVNVHSISLTVGVWIVFGSVVYNNFAGDYALASISGSSATLDNGCITIMRFAGTTSHSIAITRGVSLNSSQTLYLVGQASGGVATSYVLMYAIRVG